MNMQEVLGALNELPEREAKTVVHTWLAGHPAGECRHEEWRGSGHCAEMSCPNYINKHMH